MSVTMDVFNLFETTDYTFIKTEPVGSDIKRRNAVKYRSGMCRWARECLHSISDQMNTHGSGGKARDTRKAAARIPQWSPERFDRA